MTDEELQEDINSLIKKHFEEFEKRVTAETDTSTILLKGHLLIEHYLDNVLVLLVEGVNLHNLSFYEKVKTLEDKKCFSNEVPGALKKLNDLRNNLAHRLDFRVTFSDLDTVGFKIGRDYVLKKFSKVGDDEKSLLLFIIETLASSVFFPIFNECMKEKRKSGTK